VPDRPCSGPDLQRRRRRCRRQAGNVLPRPRGGCVTRRVHGRG
jgi:hypothetical protein